MGGTSYDEVNDILYVTGDDGEVIAYDNKKLSESIENQKRISNKAGECLVDLSIKKNYDNIFISKPLDLTKGGKNAATTYYYDGMLYASTFQGIESGLFKGYKTKIKMVNGKRVVVAEEVFTSSVPPQTQGIAVTEYNGQKYLVTTQSMGPLSNGKITVAKLNDDGTTEELGFHYAKPGIQGIKIDANGNVEYVSEFGKNETVKLTMDELLKNYDKIDRNTEFVTNVAQSFYSFKSNSEEVFNSFKNAYKKGNLMSEIKEFGGCMLDTTVGYFRLINSGAIKKVGANLADSVSNVFNKPKKVIGEVKDSVEYIAENGIDAKEFGECVVDTVKDYANDVKDVAGAVVDEVSSWMPWNW